MSTQENILEAIEAECQKLIQRHHAYHNRLDLEIARKKARGLPTAPKAVETPAVWDADQKFNPFYVYKHRHAIARSVARKLDAGTYTPNAPEKAKIPKPSGGHRTVMVYQVPDAAVSHMMYDQLLKKNKHRFSSFAYAYRNDRNAHFAIQDLSIDLRQESRVFIAEFDFSKFFDSVDRQYLFEQFKSNGFVISDQERAVIHAFLHESNTGIPQGTSISLFLANLVCWRLDKDLERAGLQFARYADDTIIWSREYGRICVAYDIIHRFSRASRVPINDEKSDGISLLCRSGTRAEFLKAKNSFDFLGYAISLDNVSINNKAVRKIKRAITYILYKHMLQPMQVPPTAITIAQVLAGQDRSVLAALQELRRYLYGDLPDQKLRNYLNGTTKRLFFKGLMSYYPLVDDERQLRQLDGWLITTLHKVIRRRARLFALAGQTVTGVFPFNVRREDIADLFRKKLVRVPSFFTIHQALRKEIVNVGMPALIGAYP